MFSYSSNLNLHPNHTFKSVLFYLMPLPISQLLGGSACSELDRISAQIQMNIEVAIYQLNGKEIILNGSKKIYIRYQPIFSSRAASNQAKIFETVGILICSEGTFNYDFHGYLMEIANLCIQQKPILRE